MRKNVFHVLGMIDDDLIAEAGNTEGRVKRIRIDKIAAIVTAALMLLGITAFAATIILGDRSSHSSNIPSYDSVPNAKTLQKDIGFVPNIPNEFSNGYCFISGHITKNEDYAEDGSIFEQYNGISCVYKKDNQEIMLYADTSRAGAQLHDAGKTKTYKGSKLQYYAYTNKIVPLNYEMTAQDKADKKSGKLVFTYGSDTVKLFNVQLLIWQDNGINYELNLSDSELAEEDLIEMAKEVMDTLEQQDRKGMN